MIDELSALKSIEERFHRASKSVELGIGDDAAAVKFNTENLVLTTTDTQVEDVHFIKSQITPAELARKAVAVSVSDIGAMGGVPRFILASVGFSKQEDKEFLDELITGFINSEQEFNLDLIGGNLSSSEKLFIDITTLGEVESELMVKRSGANPGDSVFVSGTLGDSALGLKMLLNNEKGNKNDILINKHLHPFPRLALGRELALKKIATSMIDISDGLLLDLERVTLHNGSGARIELSEIPTSKEYQEHIDQFADNNYELALSGGEDYELLFTSPEKRSEDIRKISRDLNIKITEIGKVIRDSKIDLINTNGKKTTSKKRGFVHFNN